jgi:predicted nucleic acid-binding protein
MNPRSLVTRFVAAASALAAEVRRSLEQKGQGIGLADYLIAGVCLSRRAMLLTRNHAHFARVPGLSLGMSTHG